MDEFYELDELNKIIAELDQIEYDVMAKFIGIDSLQCAVAIGNVTDKLRKAKSRLESIDKTKISE